jgi:hypothetical protein
MGVSGRLHAPSALPPRKESQFLLHMRLGASQSRSGRCGARKMACPHQKSNPDRRARSPSLYRLSYPDSSMIIRNFYGSPLKSNYGRRIYFRNIEFSDYIHRPGIKNKQTKGTRRFGNWICFRPQVRENPILLGPLERASPNHWIIIPLTVFTYVGGKHCLKFDKKL